MLEWTIAYYAHSHAVRLFDTLCFFDGVEKLNRIPISRPIVTKEMTEAAANALASERLVMGESVFKFEE